MDSRTKKANYMFWACYWLPVVLVLVALPMFFVLVLRTADGSQVKASITDLYAPVITYNSARNVLTIPSIFFALSLYDDTSMDIKYDDIVLKFYYAGSINASNIPIANYTLPGFYQHCNSDDRVRYYDHVKLKTQEIYLQEVSSEIVLHVNLETDVRFQFPIEKSWKGKKRKLLVGSNVTVSTINGKKVEIGDLKLRPYTEHGSGGHYRTVISVLYYYIGFILIWTIILLVFIIPCYQDRNLSVIVPEDHELALR